MRALFWFRSDLRLRDNRGLAAAAGSAGDGLGCLFVLDPRLLEGEHASAPRTRFLMDGLRRLRADLADRGQALVVRRGRPEEVIPELVHETRAERVVWNRDYGPFAKERDEAVRRAVSKRGAAVETWKDRVVFESGEIRSRQDRPYAVYTPYRNAWRERWSRDPQPPERAAVLPDPIRGLDAGSLPSDADLGVEGDATDIPTAGEAAARRRLKSWLEEGVHHYAARRDRPDVDGTSRLSPYLRLGMVSARECLDAAFERAREDRAFQKGCHKWADELIWREFYHAILAENPNVLHESYRPEYRSMEWDDDDERFAAWCEGRTGYPIVDAGMRQLAATGWMHNRVRMIVASFLTKDLLLDWRRGERFFLEKLVDGDPASNNGGWQWAASTGTDAQPFFRIFNPTSQGEKFDPDGDYVRRWVPELAGVDARHVHKPGAAGEGKSYPDPIVDHAAQRKEALKRYEAARDGG